MGINKYNNVHVVSKEMDGGRLAILFPFQQYSSHIRMMGG